MASQVILKKSSVAARVPVAGDLAFGELALNYADGLLYFKKSDGSISSFSGTSSSTGTVTSVAALTLGTTGTDVSSSVVNGSTTPIITLNIPTASASNRGVLSAADWSTFNSKQAAGTYATGTGSASGTNTGDETTATIKTKLGITTLSGSNTGDQTIPTTLPNANAITFNTTGGTAAGSTYTGAAVLTVDYSTVGAAAASHTHSYQAADGDLLAIGGLTGTSGYLKKTAADTWTLDTGTFLTAEADTLATVTGRGATTATAVTFSGGITGNLTGNASGLSAILAVASGGTGTATPTLVAGTNVTISGTWPNQTINSTASGGGGGTVTSVAALTLGTSGTDVSSTVATGTTTPVITLNIPTASATNRGVLSAADWTTFNSKQAAGTYATGTGSASGTNTGDETATTIKTKLSITTLSGSNTGDETAATIKTKLGITTLSGSNTGDQTIPTTLPNANAVTFASTGGAAAGSTYTGAAVLTVDYSTVGAAAASHTHSYQAADADLLAIGGLTGTSGYLKKTAADTWTLDTSTFLTAEADTLATVTSRGSSTTTPVRLLGSVAVGNVIDNSTLATLMPLNALTVGTSSSNTTPSIAFASFNIVSTSNGVLGKIKAINWNTTSATASYSSISFLTGPDSDNFGRGQIVFSTNDGPDNATTNSTVDTEKARLTYVGLGIGTSTPTQKLEVAGTIYSTSGGFKFPDGTTQTTASSSNIVTNLTDSVASWAVKDTFAGVINPTDVFFKPDGTKMFLITGTTLNQYTLSTAWDITTAGSVTSFTNTWDTVTNGMFISPDGTKLVTCGQTAVVNAGLGIVASEDRAYYLTLSTAWDITTATLVSSLKFGAGIAGLPAAETAPHGITFNDTGTIMYMIGTTVDAIYQYTLTTAYDVSTATYSKQLSIASVEAGASGIRFNIAGTRMYIIGSTSDNIVEFRLSTAWDVATAVYYDDLYITSSDSTSQGLYLDETSGNVYMVGTASDLVTRFKTNSPGILIAPTLATGRIDLVGETRIKNASLLVNGNIYSDGSMVLAGNITANQIITSSSSITLGGAVTTGTTALSIAQTTGTISIGGVAGTGAVTLGQSTAAQTLNLGTGATAAATTKTINIGTTGVSTSVTNINYGSSVTGALNTHTWNAGANSIVMDSSGNFGIGTTSPAVKLHVATSSSGAVPVFMRLANTAARAANQGASIGFWPNSDFTGAAEGAYISGIETTGTVTNNVSLVFGTGSGGTATEKVRITSDGNVGMGTSTPTQKLEVAGTVYSTSGGFKFPDGTTQTTAASGTSTATALSPFLLMGA
jgi:predicted heme/steroid binding protein